MHDSKLVTLKMGDEEFAMISKEFHYDTYLVTL